MQPNLFLRPSAVNSRQRNVVSAGIRRRVSNNQKYLLSNNTPTVSNSVAIQQNNTPTRRSSVKSNFLNGGQRNPSA